MCDRGKACSVSRILELSANGEGTTRTLYPRCDVEAPAVPCPIFIATTYNDKIWVAQVGRYS